MRDTPIEKRQSNKRTCYSVFFVGTSPNPSKGGELPNGVRFKTKSRDLLQPFEGGEYLTGWEFKTKSANIQ